MRITVDLDAQTGQPGISTESLAPSTGPGRGLNGGPANIPGGSSGQGLTSSTLSIPAQNGGMAGSGEQGSSSSQTPAQDGGAAPTLGNN